ncbi:MAG: hypothetical protein OES99_06730, partial [Gammaproteobacteria bacterium]|nr:hypothetical protein [Gammaproteobacteria bacterium]
TAKARYDVGLYFANDGDPNGDGAISGMCSVSTPPFEPEPDFLDLDGTSNDPNGMSQDVCGDIDKPDHNPLNPEITLTTACIDPDGDGKLNLPNCTSWRQSGANELCLSPLDAFPGAPSKCRCDVNFNIDIDVPPAMIEVTKTANPTLINEPGGTVTFTVSVMNDSPFAGVTLESLIDDIHGDLNGQGDCSVPQSIGFGGTYTCMFTANVSGDVGTPETDTITAIGTDENGNMVSDTDDATVDFLDVPPSALLSKTAAAADVTYNVVVTNTSTAESLMVDALVDDVYNDITTANHDGVVSTTCSVPQTIAANGGTYSCSFVATVAAPGVTDTVTGTVSDNEGGEVTPSDSASVSLN